MQSNTRINNLFRNLKEEPSFPYLEIVTTLGGDEHHTPKQLKKLKPKSTWRWRWGSKQEQHETIAIKLKTEIKRRLKIDLRGVKELSVCCDEYFVKVLVSISGRNWVRKEGTMAGEISRQVERKGREGNWKGLEKSGQVDELLSFYFSEVQVV